MLSISAMDGYRTGTFTWNEKIVKIPNLLKPKDDIFFLEDITIESPTLYRKMLKRIQGFSFWIPLVIGFLFFRQMKALGK